MLPVAKRVTCDETDSDDLEGGDDDFDY